MSSKQTALKIGAGQSSEVAKRIGVISDTHGLLRTEAAQALAGSDLIIHAGDVGKPEIVDSLKTVAPVIPVRGNVDTGFWADCLPETAVVNVQGQMIYVIHDVARLSLDPARAGCHLVVSGHSHKASLTEQSGVIYLNPGSAGPRRFKLPVTLATIDARETPWKISLVELC